MRRTGRRPATLHANLLKALPNCARIGFTGTPIIMGRRKYTATIFGEYLDRYTILQSEADGATLPILYEGRTAKAAVRDAADLDELFEDMFAEHTPEELEAIKKRWATRGNVMEAPKLIAAKARSMLRHYVDSVLPNRFQGAGGGDLAGGRGAVPGGVPGAPATSCSRNWTAWTRA